MKTITVLSIQQPWAWLIVNGYKTIENRTWHTGRRGEIYIHAGKRVDREGLAWIRDRFPEVYKKVMENYQQSMRQVGGLVGKVELTDCVREHDSPWFTGPYGFVMQRAKPIPFHPCKGQLGFFRMEIPA